MKRLVHSWSICEGLPKLGVPCWDLLHIRPPDQPVYTHIETIRDLADAVKIEGAQHFNGFDIESPSAANADAAINGLWFHATC